MDPKAGKTSPFTLMFTLDDRPGALEDALKAFKTAGVSLSSIESRPSRDSQWEYDFVTEFVVSDASLVERVHKDLGAIAKNIKVISSDPQTVQSCGTHRRALLMPCRQRALVPPEAL